MNADSIINDQSSIINVRAAETWILGETSGLAKFFCVF